MANVLNEIAEEFSHVEGDVNDKVAAWLAETQSRLVGLSSEARNLPHRAEVGFEVAADALARAGEDIGAHSAMIDGSGQRKAGAK